MRNFKKFLALVMATLMILSAAVITTGAAADKGDYSKAAQHLVALKIMKGDEKGNLMLENGVTRYQAALFFAQAVSGETAVETWNATKTSTIFTDVKDYGTAIDYTHAKGIIAGRGNGIFGPDDAITYQDMLVMAVRALGYETEDMTYPYGYILAAQKLKLTDNIDNVNFKAPLTRGETAQLIWDMLNTEIAVEDPFSGKILYPGEKGMTESLLDSGRIERTTLLVEVGYASGEFFGYIEEFIEAKDDDDVDTVLFRGIGYSNDGEDTVELYERGFEFAAADLGITADTPKVEYLGARLITILVDKSVGDFVEDYDVIAEDSEASVVFVDTPEYTVVENLGNAGNIKVDLDNETITLNGTRYSERNTNAILVFTFKGADSTRLDAGWEVNDASDFFTNFAYTTKDGYYFEDANSYGKVEYCLYNLYDEADVLMLYYTPYEFGQYFTRELKYQTTSKKANFVTIGSYENTAVENFDEVDSHFVEYVVGTNFKVTSSTTSVSKTNGERAMDVKVAGESVKSGDFMFYDYNKLDNILTVAQVGGGFKEGRLTSYNTAKETVKIDGTTKTVAFKGAFGLDINGFDKDKTLSENYAEQINSFIQNLEAGKNNVKYIEMDGNVVYMEASASSSDNEGNTFDYVIATLWDEKMADLLGYSTVEKYEADLTKGLYIDDNGYAAIAVLDTATGKWKLASVKNFHYGEFDADDEKYASKLDLAETAKYYDMVGESYTKANAFKDAYDALSDAAIFLVVNEKNGVYDLAAAPDYNAGDDTTPNLVAGSETTGLVFSDTAAKTNKIRANNDNSTARVTLNDSTVIVVVDGNEVYIRTGVQKAKRSLKLASSQTAYFLSTNSSLILMDITDATLAAGTSLENWGASSSASATESYYVALADFSVEIDSADDDTYTATLYNLFDLRTLKTVESITVTEDAISDALAHKDYAAGDVLYLNEDSELEEVDYSLAKAARLLADDEDLKDVDFDGFDFADGDSITLALAGDSDPILTTDAVTDIKIKVVTLDVTGIDDKDFDFDNAIISGKKATEKDNDEALKDIFDENAIMQEFTDGEEYFFYTLNRDEITEITAPAAGVLDNFAAYFTGNTNKVLVPGADIDYADYASLSAMKTATNDYEEIVITLSAYANVDTDKGTLDMVVFKLVK